jgi:hypothetical protein
MMNNFTLTVYNFCSPISARAVSCRGWALYRLEASVEKKEEEFIIDPWIVNAKIPDTLSHGVSCIAIFMNTVCVSDGF